MEGIANRSSSWIDPWTTSSHTLTHILLLRPKEISVLGGIFTRSFVHRQNCKPGFCLPIETVRLWWYPNSTVISFVPKGIHSTGEGRHERPERASLKSQVTLDARRCMRALMDGCVRLYETCSTSQCPALMSTQCSMYTWSLIRFLVLCFELQR